MVELVFQPDVRVIAQTIMDDPHVGEWADAHGYAHLIEDAEGNLREDTPLAHIFYECQIDNVGEFAGRFCYRSFEKGRPTPEYIKNIIEMEHGSVFEHASVSFAISGVSRSLTHELVRHRAGTAISQESQRYVDAKDIRFVVPPMILALDNDANPLLHDFRSDCERALNAYALWQESLKGDVGEGASVKFGTMQRKRALEAARSMLPNAAETRLVWTMNLRAARHVCALRGSEHADLEIRRLAVAMTRQLKEVAPHTFADFEIYAAEDGFEAVRTPHPKV